MFSYQNLTGNIFVDFTWKDIRAIDFSSIKGSNAHLDEIDIQLDVFYPVMPYKPGTGLIKNLPYKGQHLSETC